MLSFLFILFITSTTTADGRATNYGDKQILRLDKLQWVRPTTSPTFSHKSRTENGATILEMKHSDYLSKPKYQQNKRLQNRLIYDDIQFRSFQTRIRNLLSAKTQVISEAEIPIISGVKLQTLNYIVTVNLGGQNMTMIVDTGSDLTWVQCQPCKLCYNQRQPLFNPSKAPSYQPLPCNSPSCNSLQFSTGNSGICGINPPTCNYDISYGDGSYSRGELGRDLLLLGKTAPLISDFVFGCGRNNKGLFGGVSGLMGLGRNELSLVSQTSNIFGGTFSYCLPLTQADASGSLILGGDSSVYKNSTPITYTRLLPNPQLSTFYFLNLTGISLGGVALNAQAFGKGGILIDSGTVITRLPPSIYNALKAEFLKQFSGYPQVPGFSILDTCFNLSAYDEVNIPKLTMQFEGEGALNVDVQGMFYFVKTDASQVCLGLASLSYEDEIGIIGNYQQRNTRVVYDTLESKLGFAEETCSFI